MRTWCVLASLSALQAGARAPREPGGDDVLLVQKGLTSREGNLHADSSGELAPLSPSREDLLLKVQDVLRQLPIRLPFGLPLKLPTNASAEDLAAMSQKIFRTFRNKSFVLALHEVLEKLSMAWARFVSTEQEAAANLNTSCAGESRETTVKELETFWRTGEDGLVRFFAKAFSVVKRLVRTQPNEIKTILAALANASGASEDPATLNASSADDASPPDSSGFPTNVANYTADVLFSNASKVCSKFGNIWMNLMGVESGLEKAVAFLANKDKILPEVEALIVELAPDVSDSVMGVINASMDTALNMTSSNLAVTKPAFAVVKEQLEGCLSCTMPVVAGSMGSGPSAFLGFALVLAAWLGFQH